MDRLKIDKLYTAGQARRRLGEMAPSSFKRLVDAGKIRKVTPPNKKQGMYLKEDVDRLAEMMQEFATIYSTTPTDKYEFVQAQGENEIKETVQIARQHLGENAYGLEKRMAWFHLSPKGDYVLKHDGIIVGYFSMQAIKSEAIDGVFRHKSGRSIQLEDMEPIVSGKPLDVHISGIGVRRGISRQQANIYGRRLLMGLIEKLIELGKQDIDIRRIWAKSSTVSGIKISRNLGFTELGYINSEQIGFVLDLEEAKSYSVQTYRDALRQTKKPL